MYCYWNEPWTFFNPMAIARWAFDLLILVFHFLTILFLTSLLLNFGFWLKEFSNLPLNHLMLNKLTLNCDMIPRTWSSSNCLAQVCTSFSFLTANNLLRVRTHNMHTIHINLVLQYNTPELSNHHFVLISSSSLNG